MLNAMLTSPPPFVGCHQAIDSLELTDEKINAITDQIPQRPMGIVEGTSYSIVILFAFGVRWSTGGRAAGSMAL